MRKRLVLLTCLAATVVVFTGCVGPERKLGRGINNVTELVRGGEMRRSMEQTAIFVNHDAGYTTGLIHGFHRSLARTGVGIYEIVTAPFPPYDPVIFPENPVYPASFKPDIWASQTFSPHAKLGFGARGTIAPFVPGSRFRVFE